MKVRELKQLVEYADPEADVLICDDGSILRTDTLKEHEDYNKGSESEIFIIVEPYQGSVEGALL